MSQFSVLLTGLLRSRLTKGSVLRGIGVFALSLGTTLGVIYINYHHYWEEMSDRTQTIDSNVLSNLLPTKLSLYLSKKRLSKADYVGLQHILDSHYGLLGIIITDCQIRDRDCPTQKIIYASNASVRKTPTGHPMVIPATDQAKRWTAKFENSTAAMQLLTESSFVILRNPPPLNQEWEIKPSQSDEKASTNQQYSEHILGRAYFVKADKPSFIDELQNWLKDIPTRLLGNRDQTELNSRSSVYNAIALSTLITGLLVLLIMEFAYYLARIAQENEAKAIQAKLNTEQKLQSALARIRKAIQEKLEAEEAARIAAEKREQAIQEKLEAEATIRITAEKREQAIREKQQAEAAAQIAAEEREQARQDARELYNSIEEATRESEQRVSDLTAENAQLRARKLNFIQVENSQLFTSKSATDSAIIAIKVTEKDFYDQEIKELVLDILRKFKDVHSGSRSQHILENILANNTSNNNYREEFRTEIHTLFRDYKKMNSKTRKALERMGFEIISERKHYRVRFHGDNRYVITFAKTPSDNRAGMNIASDICNLLL